MFKKKDKAKKGQPPEAEAEAAAAPEAVEGAEGEAAAPEGKKKLPIKLIAIAAAVLVVLGGGGGGGAYYFLVMKKAPADGEHAEDGHAPKKKEKKKDDGHGGAAAAGDGTGCAIREGPDGVVFCTLPDLVTNIQTTDGRPNLLKLKITFELADEHGAEAVSEQMPRLQDLLQTFLRELRPEDLSGSQGTYRLRQEIQRRVNLVIAPSKVNAVLLEEMLQT